MQPTYNVDFLHSRDIVSLNLSERFTCCLTADFLQVFSLYFHAILYFIGNFLDILFKVSRLSPIEMAFTF